MEVTQVVEEKLITTKDGLSRMHCEYSLYPLLSIPPLLHPYSKQAVEVTVAAVFFFGVIHFIENGFFELSVLSSVVFEFIG